MSKAMALRLSPTHLAVRKGAPNTKFSIRADVKSAEAVTDSAEKQIALRLSSRG